MKIFITGGTGTLGRELVKQLYKRHVLTILSRDEYKISLLKRDYLHDQFNYVIGDIKDKIDLTGIDIVIHLAALKHVYIGQEFPYEAVKTNIIGTQNIIEACKKYKVKKLIYVSTDKSVEPVNVYGMTKHIAEKMILNELNIKSSIIRSGNIWNSRGSCIPYFIERKKQGKKIHLTDINMKRYFIDCSDLTSFIIKIMKSGKDKKIYIPKMKHIKILDIIKSLKCDYGIIGKREGEKIIEKLVWDNENNVEELNG